MLPIPGIQQTSLSTALNEGLGGYASKELTLNLWIKHTHHIAKENTTQHINKYIKL